MDIVLIGKSRQKSIRKVISHWYDTLGLAVIILQTDEKILAFHGFHQGIDNKSINNYQRE